MSNEITLEDINSLDYPGYDRKEFRVMFGGSGTLGQYDSLEVALEAFEGADYSEHNVSLEVWIYDDKVLMPIATVELAQKGEHLPF